MSSVIRPAGADEAWVVHVAQAWRQRFSAAGGGGDILIAPQLTSRQLGRGVAWAAAYGFLASLPEITATFLLQLHPTVWASVSCCVWLRLAGRLLLITPSSPF
ncbi:hypothetical protein LAD77_01350 [Klebsiella pneumoniae]|nr:hypothetical protein [Klebsiella pneumoniae]